MNNNYLVIDTRVLPEVFTKVIETKKMLAEGRVKEITEATKLTGISRSVYYKYKDSVFEFSEISMGKKISFKLVVNHKKGILSTVLNFIAESGGNIITLDQGTPIKNEANIAITIDITNLDRDFKMFLEDLSTIPDVKDVEFISME